MVASIVMTLMSYKENGEKHRICRSRDPGARCEVTSEVFIQTMLRLEGAAVRLVSVATATMTRQR